MAQRMLDEKTRVTEAGPEVYGESARSSFHEEQEEDVSDGETLGSQDTTNGLTDISEEEEEENLFEGNKENIPPPRRPPRNRRLRAAYSLEEPLLPPSAATDKKSKKVPKRRGKYRSWAKHRVAICQALRDAVFDRKKAGEILKRGHRLFVPATVIGYYARKLSPSFLAPLSSHTAPLLPPKKHRR
ncbi:22K [Fowl aviadenovirus A]|nr:22K [Fowl aviadenovirus A]WNM87876.1 22K [Fowl aviadenovirus A]WNM87915.1 22K [Fowl aviadenovirus A]WNM88188.1 22K [Fowl aviadenovirus A]